MIGHDAKLKSRGDTKLSVSIVLDINFVFRTFIISVTMYLLLTEKRFNIDEMEEQKTTMTPRPGIMALVGMSGVQEPLAHRAIGGFIRIKKKERKKSKIGLIPLFCRHDVYRAYLFFCQKSKASRASCFKEAHSSGYLSFNDWTGEGRLTTILPGTNGKN